MHNSNTKIDINTNHTSIDPYAKTTIIAVANQKGGVAKTTSTINLATALTQAGYKVLVIDSDPQSSLSIVWGINPRRMQELDSAGLTYYFGLVKNKPLIDLVIAGLANPANSTPSLSPSLIPASIRLANAETELASPFGTASILKEKLESLRGLFDVILIDCPPTLSLLTVNALTASDAVLIPVKTDFISVMGLTLLLDTVENVKRRANPTLEVLGILPTLFNASASHDAEVLRELKASVAHKQIQVFDPVHRSTAFDKANVESKSALELFPNTKGINQYTLVAQKIINTYVKPQH
jgi:chromosome partitioning protein